MSYKVEIQTDSGYRNITPYVQDEPDITLSIEGEFTWLHWFDSISIRCESELLFDYDIKSKQRIEIQHQRNAHITGFVHEISGDPYKDQEVDIDIIGYDKLLSKEIISLGGTQESVTEMVKKIRDKVNPKLRERGYDISGLGKNIDCKDDIDFLEYKGFDLSRINFENKDMNYTRADDPQRDIYQKGYFIEIENDDFTPFTEEYPKEDLADPFFKSKNTKILYGIIYGYARMDVGLAADYQAFDIKLYYYDDEEDEVKQYWTVERKEEPGMTFWAFASNGFYVIKIGGRYFRRLAEEGEGKIDYNYTNKTNVSDWDKWIPYMEKLIVEQSDKILGYFLSGSEVYDATIQELIPFRDQFYISVTIKYRVVTEVHDDGTAETEDRSTETRMYGEIVEADLLSYAYQDAKAGKILKDLLIVTDNLLYISNDTIAINDREKGRGQIQIEVEDIEEYQEIEKDMEFEGPIKVSVSNTIIESEDDTGGIFVMEGLPYDIKGDIIEHYENLSDTSKEQKYNLTIDNDGKYDDIIGKVDQKGNVVNTDPQWDTVELKTKKRI